MIPTGGVRLGGNAEKDLTPAQMAARAAQKRLEDKVWCGGSQTIVIEDSEEESTDRVGTKRKGSTNNPSENRQQKKNRLAQTESDTWKCATCTFQNQALVLVCQVCLYERPAENNKDHWQCPQCTLMNERKWKTCTACSFIFLH
jgi:hypothetical protein